MSEHELTPFNPDTIDYNRVNGYPDLDDQRRAFCIIYVTNGYNHRKAAEEVGFPPDRGVRLKQEQLISVYINDLMKQYEGEFVVNKKIMDSKLDALEDIAMGVVEIPLVTGAGDSIEAKKFHPELAMKVYTERVRLHKIVEDEKGSGHVSVTINMAGMVGTELPVIDVEVKSDE